MNDPLRSIARNDYVLEYVHEYVLSILESPPTNTHLLFVVL
jgi:hypothetical protein